MIFSKCVSSNRENKRKKKKNHYFTTCIFSPFFGHHFVSPLLSSRNYRLALASRDERSNAIVTDALYFVSRLVRFVLINFTVPDPTEVLTDVKTVRVVNEVRPSGRQAGRSSFTKIIRRGKGVKRMGKSAR